MWAYVVRHSGEGGQTALWSPQPLLLEPCLRPLPALFGCMWLCGWESGRHIGQGQKQGIYSTLEDLV